MRSKLAALAALSLITVSSGASAQTLSQPGIGLSERSGETVEGANAAEGAWILIPIVLGTLAVLIIAVSVSDNGASDSP
jgi:hypothetical protein